MAFGVSYNRTLEVRFVLTQDIQSRNQSFFGNNALAPKGYYGKDGEEEMDIVGGNATVICTAVHGLTIL